MVENRTHKWKGCAFESRQAGIVGGGSECAALLSTLNTTTQGALVQGTEPPTAPQTPQHKWLPTASGVCVFTAVCVHLDG